MTPFLFMGVQPDPEMDVLEGRAITRIYDGTAQQPRPERGAKPKCMRPWSCARGWRCERCAEWLGEEARP